MPANTDLQPPRVLTEDMTWAPIDTLAVGQRVVTFDEEPRTHRYRMYRIGKITDIQPTTAEMLRVTTSRGEIDVPATRPLFVKKWSRTMFREARKLEPEDEVFWFAPARTYTENGAYKRGYILGAFAGDGSVPGYKARDANARCDGSYGSSVDEEVGETVVAYAADVAPEYNLTLKQRSYNGRGDTASMACAPSASDNHIREDLVSEHPSSNRDYARGWLAGLFDTDGTFPKAKELGYCQYEGRIFDRVCEYLDLLGYDWSHDEGTQGDFSDKIRLTPGRETGRTFEHLLEIRPKVYRKRMGFVNNRRVGNRTTITSVEPVGTKRMIRADTTSGTLITEGILSATT